MYYYILLVFRLRPHRGTNLDRSPVKSDSFVRKVRFHWDQSKTWIPSWYHGASSDREGTCRCMPGVLVKDLFVFLSTLGSPDKLAVYIFYITYVISGKCSETYNLKYVKLVFELEIWGNKYGPGTVPTAASQPLLRAPQNHCDSKPIMNVRTDLILVRSGRPVSPALIWFGVCMLNIA